MSETYADIETGEELDDDTLHERYDDMLDEVTSDGDGVHIGNLTYAASAVLKAVDPIAYRVGFNDWLDSELGETIIDRDEVIDAAIKAGVLSPAARDMEWIDVLDQYGAVNGLDDDEAWIEIRDA